MHQKSPKDVVIVNACRTPVGKIRGALAHVRPDDLLAEVLKALLIRVNIDSSLLDEVFAGCANQAGEDNRNVARMASLLAGFTESVPGVTLNRLCASGLEAIVQATRAIQTGDAQLVIASGVESMSRAPYVMAKAAQAFASGAPAVYDSALGWRFPNPRLADRFPLESMGETAENIAERFSISREAQDAFAYQSHQKACAAMKAGFFQQDIVPVAGLEQDEGPRVDTSLEKLAGLKPAFRANGSVTAGNSSSLNDGAAALLLSSRAFAQSHGLPILGRVRSSASAGVDPRFMGLGPVPATQKALQKAGLCMGDIDVVELNEAFAAQALAVMRELRLSEEKVNVWGGAIAIGHPLGASGARLVLNLLSVMRKKKASLGLATLCVGVGQGLSVIVECES